MNIHSYQERAMTKPKTRPPVEEREDAPKREAILDAALELFAERGYHGTAVPLVAERAGVGAGTLYRYFAGKEALVNALYQRWKLMMGRVLLADFPFGAPVRAQFHEVWRRLARFGERYPRAFEFLEMHHHGGYLDEESRRVERALLEPIRHFIEEAQRQELIKPLQPELLGAMVFGAFIGLVRASRQGLVALTAQALDDVEQCLWEAVRR